MINKKTIFLFPIFFFCAILLASPIIFYYISKNHIEKKVNIKWDVKTLEEKLFKTEVRKFIFEDIKRCSDAFWSGNADIHQECAKQREEYINQVYFGQPNIDVFTLKKKGLEKFYEKNENGGFTIDSVIKQDYYKNYGDSDDSIYHFYTIKYLLKPYQDFPKENQRVCEIFKKSFNKELYLKNLNEEFGHDYFEKRDTIFDPSLWTGDPDFDLYITCLHWPRWGQEFIIEYNQNNDIHFKIEFLKGYAY